MKKVLIIPGTQLQIPLINKVKSMDHIALTIAKEEYSPAYECADGFAIVDVLDKVTCLNYAIDANIDAIVCDQSDAAIPTISYIAEQMNLPAIRSPEASLFTNKLNMYNFCRLHNILCPEYSLCYTIKDVINFFHKINKKIIIKPIDSNGSKGVFTISSEDEIEKYFDEVLLFSKVEKAILAQRYIDGVEFTVDGIKTTNKHHSILISEKKHYLHNKNIASQLFFSHQNDKYDYSSLKRINNLFVDNSNLKFGLTHAEYIFEKGNYYLIEIAARGGGNFISSDIFPLMTGIDNYEFLIKSSLGETIPTNYIINSTHINRCAVLYFFDTPGKGGIVKEIKGLDYLNENKKIVKYHFNFKIGDYISQAIDDTTRVGYYIAYGDTRTELMDIMNSIKNYVEIVV